MTYGAAVGTKFYEDGRVRRYPGNTCVADITPACPAYEVMTKIRKLVIEAGMEEYFVLLPEDSYHMTLIRGLNHQVRKEGFWPPLLSKELPMTEVDDYIEAAMNRAVLPKTCHMKFRSVNQSSKSCIVIYLDPADEEENKKLRDFRDRAAEEIGFRLPKHEEYNFHISLAYTRVIPEGEAAEKMDALREKINELLANEPAFDTAEPYVAFYDDMYAFHPHRIPRD